MNDELAHYEVDIDLANPNTSHAQVAALVGRDQRVLDVGCWTGDLSRVLRQRGCTVSGVEIDPAAADRARAHLDEVVVLDLDKDRVSEHFEAGSFDVVVIADVLEHLIAPAVMLADVCGLLAPGGRVVASIPNVTHGSVRLALLQGRWAYTETGLLDLTHLRFFDRSNLVNLFHAGGMLIDDLRATTADPLGVEVVIDADLLPPTAVEWVRDQPDALVYQFVLAAHPAAAGEKQDPAGLVLHPSAPDETVRLSDRHTEKMNADIEARHRVLTVRDHVVGLEASTATAQARADLAERQLKGARKRLDRKNERIQELTQQVKELQTTVGPLQHRGPLGRLRARG